MKYIRTADNLAQTWKECKEHDLCEHVAFQVGYLVALLEDAIASLRRAEEEASSRE